MGGFQGLLGWYMVKSGLVDNPRVSQYRLTSHLGVAVAIYAYMLWLVLDLMPRTSTAAGQGERGRYGRVSLLLVALVFLMILSGGLVAVRRGLDLPHLAKDGRGVIPPGLYSMSPAWLSAFEDMATIQFNHRMFAYLLVVVLVSFLVLVWRHTSESRTRLAVALVGLMLCVQVSLGISTLLLHVPVAVATAHQGGAVLLLSAVLFLSYSLQRQQVDATSPEAG